MFKSSSSGSGKQLRFITISILLMFSVSILTFYWIVVTTTTTQSTLSNFPEEEEAIFLVTLPQKSQDELDNSIPIIIKPKEKTDFLQDAEIVRDNNNLDPKYSKYSDSGDQDDAEESSLSSVGNNNKFREVEAEIRMRIQRVSNTCKRYHLGRYNWPKNGSNDLNEKEPPTPLYSYFFWNRQRHLSWCPVCKAGSTSWLYNMMILAGYSESELDNPPKQFSVMAREVYGDAEPDPETLEQSLKLLIVRHPFERLVSAYKDKLSNASIGHEHGTLHFYKKYGQKIVKKYRKDKSLKQLEPTWPEFVDYLLSTNLINYSDDHWLPAYYSCTPCLLDYDIIAKLETFTRDQEYIIYKAGLEGLIKPRWNHKTSQPNSIAFSSTSYKYFNQLNKSTIEKLYRKYWFDFELFGYDYKEYLKYARDFN